MAALNEHAAGLSPTTRDTLFKEHNFPVGLSVDGPRELHNTCRRDRRGQGTLDLVMRGWRLLRQYGVRPPPYSGINAATAVPRGAVSIQSGLRSHASACGASGTAR
jgi:hypothetical protein